MPASLHLALEPHLAGNIECRSIGTSKWYWSRVNWQMYVIPRGESGPVVASWDTSFLFSATDDDASLLRSGPLTEIDPEDLSPEMQEALSADLEQAAAIQNQMQIPIDIGDQQEIALDPHDLQATGEAAPVTESFPEDRFESVFQYERAVIRALHRIGGLVRYTRAATDPGVDAVLRTPEGTIGIAIKHGRSPRLPRHLGEKQPTARPVIDAILTVTNMPITSRFSTYGRSAQGDSRPREITRWTGPQHDEKLAKSIRLLRHQLSDNEL